MQFPSLRLLLRERTSDLHAAVDESVGTFTDIDAYRRYLRGFHAFRAPCEAAIAAAGGLAGWHHQPLVPLVEADMADLGMAVPERRALVGEPSADDELAGWLYVLEGSALGARVLASRARALGLDATFGARHLAAQGGSAPGFRAFIARLDDAALNPDRVVAAAIAAFTAAQRAFAGADLLEGTDARA